MLFILLTSKGGNIAFPPPIPSMQHCADVRATYRKQTFVSAMLLCGNFFLLSSSFHHCQVLAFPVSALSLFSALN